VDEALQVGQKISDLLGRGGTKAASPGRVPPIQFRERRSSPGCSPSAADPVEQPPVGLAQHAYADRQALPVAQLRLHPAKGTQIIGDLFDVVGVADLEPGFLVEQVWSAWLECPRSAR
jgi:hypothetical protein